jgi:hypothetical protein
MTFLRRFLRTRFLAATALLAAMLLAAPAPARADEPPPSPTVPHPFAYGILVGTNVGGAGQQTLRYAEDDARKMADVLRQLGRYGDADLRVLVRPDNAKLLATVDEIAAKMRAHQAKGEQAVLVFYYSGHARAGSFSLGGEELAVTTLREKLRQIPSTLTLVILDACQSGQFARIKGVESAADFSTNSVSRLTTKGIAVMASSTAQELSQESDELRSSYFTHHLIVALRGAADVELPGPLEARILVQHKASGSVVAEVLKVKGAPLRLAFTAGTYEAIVRDNAALGKVLRCPLTLSDERVVALDFATCQNVRITSKGLIKGEDEPDDPEPDVTPSPVTGRPVESWTIEAAFGFMSRVDGPYTRSLETFGYRKDRGLFEPPRARASLGVSKGIVPHLTVGLNLTTLGGDGYVRDVGDADDSFRLDAYGASVFVRASTELFGSARSPAAYVDLYGQVGGGMTLGFTRLTTGSTRSNTSETTKETDVGYLLAGAAGIGITKTPVTVFFQGGYDYAPTIANLFGDVYNAGGPTGQLGLRVQLGH